MSFEHRQTGELIQIALAGGGFRLTATYRQTQDLVQIAAAAAKGGASVILTGLTNRSTNDLLQIAAAGKGAVIFEG